MELKDGNFIVTKEEIDALLSPDTLHTQKGEGYFNPQRLKVVWAYLNSTHTQGKKLPITPKQYRELIKVLFKTLDADMRRNIEKYFIAFDLASDYARGVGRGAYHYFAELYALKANMAIYTLLRTIESLTEAKRMGHPEGLDILIKDGVLAEEDRGDIKDYIGEDGKTYFRYGGKNKEEIRADMVRGIQYLYNNLRGFKADIEGMLKYLEELIPVEYLEPFGMDIEHTLPLSLQNYIYRMEKGFIEEVGVDINETTSGDGKGAVYPTYRGIKADARKVDAQYKAFKKIIETRWQNE